MTELNVVTGAFSYTGKYIARRLLALGKEVRTLTGHARHPDPFEGRVTAVPYSFDRPQELVEGLRGATTLYNTYWVRFPRGQVTFERVVENTRKLIRAAEEAGVRRIVHISITSASSRLPLPYFRGKGLLEEAIAASRLSYAIIRPTVVFGKEDVLINNIAWFLRHFPVFTIFDRGDYKLQPVYVEDLADLAVSAGQRGDNVALDAVGPETFTFEGLVRLIASAVGSKARIVHASPGVALLLSRLAGYVVGDVVLTRDEVAGLMMGLLVSSGSPTCPTRLSDWLAQNAATLGVHYASELRRHYS